MNNSSKLAAGVHRALDEGRLLQGNLIHTEISVDAPAATWHLATRLPADVVALFRKERLAAVMTSQVVGREDRHCSWVIGYQARNVLHRFVLPLVGSTVSAMIDRMRVSPLGVLLHTDLEATFHEAQAPISQESLAILSAQHQPIINGAEAIQEHATTVAEALNPDFVVRAKGLPRPTKVYVSSVLPLELAEVTPGEHFGGWRGGPPPMLSVKFKTND